MESSKRDNKGKSFNIFNYFFVMDIEDDQQVPIILGRSFVRTTHVPINVCKGVYTLREGKKKMFYYIQGIEDFPNKSTHQQHLYNPYAIRQAIDIKEVLIGWQSNFLTLTFYIIFIVF